MKKKYFNLNAIKKNPFILIFGRRSTGKTTIVKEYLKISKYSKEDVIVFTKPDTSYQEFSNNQYTQYDPDILKNLIEEQIDNNVTSKIVIINSLFIPITGKNKYIYQIILNGRHLNIALIIISQIYLSLPAETRLNVDYVFFTKYHHSFYKQIHDNYYGIDTLDEFITRCDKLNNEFLVIDIVLFCLKYLKLKTKRLTYRISRKHIQKLISDKCIKIEDKISIEV